MNAVTSAPQAVQNALSRGMEPLSLRLAILWGQRDENKLTNLVFFARHPERDGRKLTRDEPRFSTLSQEWLDIRDRLVRSALGAQPSTPTTPTRPATAGDADARRAQQIAASPVSTVTGAEPQLLGVTVGDLVEQWRVRICPEIPKEILLAFIVYESGGRFDDATHGSEKNRWTSPEFYELGIFQTPAGLHGRCTSGNRRATDCEFPPPGREKPQDPSTWIRLCRKIGADPMQWRNPTTQVQVGLNDLEGGAAQIRKAYPELFPTRGSDWDLRMAVLYPFSRGGGAARSFLTPFRAQLAGMAEDQRWAFLRNKQVRVSSSFVRPFAGENVEKKMALAAKLGYVPRG